MSRLNRFLNTSKIVSLTLTGLLSFISGISHAEDTEIYFSNKIQIGETERPNLLFILDSSGSMQSSAGTSGQTRIEALKEAMNIILNDVEGVNVGLMRFNTFDGGPVLFPISYIDGAASSVAGEPEDVNPSYSYTITNGDNDAIELVSYNDNSLTSNGIAITAGEMDLSVTSAYLVNSPDITGSVTTSGDMSDTFQTRVSSSSDDTDEYFGGSNTTEGRIYFDSSGNTHDGIRFTNINIPVNARIDDARLRLRTRDSAVARSADVFAIKADNVATFNGSNNEVSSATLTSANVNWNVTQTQANRNVDSPDLKDIIQEIVSNGCTTVGDGSTAGPCTWSTNNSIALVLKNGSGLKTFYSFDGSGGTVERRPRLTIDWTLPGASTTTPGIEGKTYITGLRFDSVDIPKGATVTSARLKVTSSANNQSDPITGASIWNVTAEDAGNSAEFNNTTSNLSSRAKTTMSESWSIPGSDTWTNTSSGGGIVATNAESPDLKSIVQEVIDRGDWCGGNAMSFFIQEASAMNASNNGRQIYHSEGGYGAKLEVEYDVSSATGGCINETNSDQIVSGDSDAEENSSNNSMDLTSSDLDFNTSTVVGLHFDEVDVPKGVTITDAVIQFTSDSAGTGAANMTISIESTDNASIYSSNNADITSGRTYEGTTVSWVPDDWDAANENHSTSNLASLIQLVVNRSGWQSGNDMAFRITTTGNSRAAKSRDNGSGVTTAPRLIISYQGEATSQQKTVRERLIEIVNDIPAADATPITETLFEAANYWSGANVQLGKARYHVDDPTGFYAADNRISHPGSYCSEDPSTGVVNCGAANTASFPNFGISTPAGCSESNLDDSDCINRNIQGTDVKYISPFNADSQCAANYQILVTDGEANSLTNTYETAIRTDYLSGAACDITRPDGTTVAASEDCALDLVEHMANNDLSSTIDDEQTVITYTIGFDTASLVNATNFLTNMAAVGEGEFNEADDAASLASTFTEILADVRQEPTSFAAPGFTQDVFNPLETRDVSIFALFTPDTRRAWKGNLKKFRLCTSDITEDPNAPAMCDRNGRILDANGNHAIGADNRINTSALSFWTDPTRLTDPNLTTDGIETLQGGAGQQADDYTARVIYTETTASGNQPTVGTILNVPQFRLTEATWDSSNMANVRNRVCTLPDTTDGSDCANLMQWMLGKVIDNDATDVDADSRWIIGSVLHSSPGLITYGGIDTDGNGEPDEFFDKVVVASNSGALHFFNASNDPVAGGTEEWAFMPQAVLSQQEALFTNSEGQHLSVLDLPPVIIQCDGDRDGFIEPTATGDGCDANQDGVADGDFVHVIAGMRRGGRNYYALDISGDATLIDDGDNSIEPKFLWRIEGGVTPGFEDLATTWSIPTFTTISVTDSLGVQKDMDVLMFGGGYDTALDTQFGANGLVSPTDSNNDNLGNIVYIVNPSNGQLIFSIGGNGTNATIKVPDMHHSIPGQISTLDSDSDGDTDRIYFGDTGGQLWRVDLADDINPDSGSGTPQGRSLVGRLASISGIGGSPAINQRRFLRKPAIAQVIDKTFSGNSIYDAIVLGTGNQSNPLDRDTEDYLFVFRDYQTSPMTPLSATSNLAQDYPTKSSGTGPITVADMVDATNDILADLDNSIVQASSGYYINYSTSTLRASERDGEKVLSSARISQGEVTVNTYSPSKIVPGTNTENCLAQIGASEEQAFFLLSADGVYSTGVGGRSSGVYLGGISGDPAIVFSKDGDGYLFNPGEGGGDQTKERKLLSVNRDRTYWYEY